MGNDNKRAMLAMALIGKRLLEGRQAWIGSKNKGALVIWPVARRV